MTMPLLMIHFFSVPVMALIGITAIATALMPMISLSNTWRILLGLAGTFFVAVPTIAQVISLDAPYGFVTTTMFAASVLFHMTATIVAVICLYHLVAAILAEKITR